MNNEVLEFKRSTISYLLRTYWKTYAWQVLVAALIVLSVGTFQHHVVLGMAFDQIHPRLLIVPAVVGSVFGFLYTTVRLMQREQRKQVVLMERKEFELLDQIERREAADKREKRLSYAMQGSDDGLWDWNIKTGEVYYSPRWEEMLGYEPGEISNHVDSWRDLVHPADAQETFSVLEQHLRGERQQYLKEMRLRMRNGEWLWVLGRGQVVEFDEQGKPLRAVGTMSDISNRKRVEEALRALMSGTAGTLGNEFFQNLVHSLSDVLNVRFVILATLDSIIPGRLKATAVWDRRFVERFSCCSLDGTPCAETVRKGFHVIEKDLRHVFPKDEMIERLDGESYLGVALYDQAGNVAGVIAIIDSSPLQQWKIDLAKIILPIFSARASAEVERRSIEEELIEQKEQAQVTLHSIGDAVVTTDAEGYIEYMNPAAEKITGWPAKSTVGMHIDEICVAVDKKGNPVGNIALYDCLKTGNTNYEVNKVRLENIKGEYIETEQTVSPIRDRNSAVRGAVVVFRDVSRAHEMAIKMSWQARHDALTGLINRREFEDRLAQLIDTANQENQCHALLYMDLDQFKVVNDTCGHTAGDELLRQLTAMLKDNVRQSDTLARLGGDEFGLLLVGCDVVKAKAMAESMISTVQEFRFVWEDKIFHVGASIGLVEITPQTENPASIMQGADMACYAAKEGGRNRIYVYQAGDEMVEQRQIEMHWVSRVKEAIEQEDICLYAQQIMSLESGEVHHYEILARMRQKNGTIIPPGSFVPAAERYNIAVDIDQYVVKKIFGYIRDGQIPEDAVLSINLSGKSLGDENLMHSILESADKLGIKHGAICFEITETSAIANLAYAMKFISRLHDAGFLFSLDDFGSGLSSFGYLKQLPVDFLKIDGSFVRDMVEDTIDAAMVSAINEIGHRMNKLTIAEFVENQDILEALQGIGVDFAQGFHVHKPEPLENIFSSIREKKDAYEHVKQNI